MQVDEVSPFNEPDAAAGLKNDPNRIQATQDVAALARGDADADTFNIDPDQIEAAITERRRSSEEASPPLTSGWCFLTRSL